MMARKAVALELTPLRRPGAQRGLGRYATTVLAAALAEGYRVAPMFMKDRGGRSAEFVDVLERQRRLVGVRCCVFHATNPHVCAFWARGRTVASILDVIQLDYPGYRTTGIKAQAFLSLAARGDVVLTLSEFSARRIEALLHVSRDRILVAPLPPAQSFAPEPVGIWRDRPKVHARPYFSAVADLTVRDPRKRIDWLPEIARLVQREGYQLVVAGPGTERWVDRQSGIRGTGRVSDDELADVMRGSAAFIHASAYEGQGLPPLEAMACGTPVVAMSNSAIPEMVGGAGVLVDEPKDEDADARRIRGVRAIAEACLDVASNPSKSEAMRAAVLERSKGYTFGRFREMLNVAYGE